MFSSKNNDQSAVPNGGTTIIGNGAILTGDIVSDADIRIDGHLNGNVNSKGRVLVGAHGKINGHIVAQQADISGVVHGSIKVKELLSLRANADVKGDVYAAKLSVEPSVALNGHVHMGANVVDIKTESDATEPRALNI